MTTGQVSSIVSVIGTVLTFLGITGIDASVLGTAVQGVIAFVTIGASVVTYIEHRHAVQTIQSH